MLEQQLASTRLNLMLDGRKPRADMTMILRNAASFIYLLYHIGF